MVKKRWSKKAYESLKYIHELIKDKSERSNQVVTEIYNKIDQLQYPNQYQVDEILGAPYRRMVTRHYRIVYKVVSDQEIEILQIFDNRQSPERTKREFGKK